MPIPEDRSRLADDWDGAACGLLRIDAKGLITAANARVLERTGYDAAQLVGRLYWTDLLAIGSRLFYDTQLAPVLELDGVLEEVMLDLRHADGSRTPALVNAVRLSDTDGRRIGARVALVNVPDRRAYESELRQARADAQRSADAHAQSRRRIELLAHANVALASSVEVEVGLTRLAEVLVADLADWCLIYSSDPAEPDQPLRSAGVHADPANQAALDELAWLLPLHASPTSAFRLVTASGRPMLIPEISATHQRESTDSDDLLALYPVVGLGSAMVVPTTTQGRQVATILAVRREDRPPFTDDDLAILTDLAARTAIVIENLRRQDREHSNSLILQQTLLGTPIHIPSVDIATRYLPATDANDVGGDWYDTFLLPDGDGVLVIGDVVGHDLRAAAAMGQLRSLIRAVGYTNAGTPATMLTRAETTAKALQVDALATALIARITTDPGSDSALMQWTNAGHLPPVLIEHSGRTRLLDTAPDRLLGLRTSRQRHDHITTLGPGDTVLLYTDGLIERPGQDIDDGMAQLLESLIDTQDWALEDICDWALAGHRNARRDDIAILAYRLTPRST